MLCFLGAVNVPIPEGQQDTAQKTGKIHWFCEVFWYFLESIWNNHPQAHRNAYD